MGGINYLTGQVFDMQAITKATHEVGAIAGFDLAHAAGNIPMQLHDWNVDFAVWCTYKYINSGPGSVAGAFVHERHANDNTLPRFAGWWGYEESTRFLMKKGFVPMHGAAGWQLANQNILSNAAHQASLDIFDRTSMEALRAKSELLTGYLEFLLLQVTTVGIQIITPQDARGAQLSIVIDKGKAFFNYLMENGVIGDWREPDVIRLAPAPLYCSFADVFRCYQVIQAYKG
jgi:kynureninase